MHKIITPKNILQLLTEQINEENPKCNKSELIEDLAELTAKHFGGEVGTISFEDGATDPFWIVLHKGDLNPVENPYEQFEEGWRNF
jgi:hypothetical protein